LPYKMDAVEIYEPYIERFNLRSKYRNIIIDDIMNIDLTPYDYVLQIGGRFNAANVLLYEVPTYLR